MDQDTDKSTRGGGVSVGAGALRGASRRGTWKGHGRERESDKERKMKEREGDRDI